MEQVEKRVGWGQEGLELDQSCSCYTGVLLSWVKCGLKHIAVCYEQASLVSCNGLPVFINRRFFGENMHSHESRLLRNLEHSYCCYAITIVPLYTTNITPVSLCL